MRAPIAGAVNVMEAPFFDPDHYRSDSNQHWRHGCPHEELAAGAFEWLQLLTHPEIWAFDGATMRETMESMLDADRAARLEHLRNDRIDLSSREADHRHGHRLGRAGTAALLHALASNGEREVRLVGTDMSERSVGRHLCDAFHIVPAARPGVPDAMLAIGSGGRRRDPAAVVVRPRGARGARRPLPDAGARVVPDAIRRSNDKAETYEFLHRLGLPAPSSGVSTVRARSQPPRRARLPRAAVCFKPVFSSGRAASASSTRRSTARTSCERAARLGGDAPRRGGRAAAGGAGLTCS